MRTAGGIWKKNIGNGENYKNFVDGNFVQIYYIVIVKILLMKKSMLALSKSEEGEQANKKGRGTLQWKAY